MPQASAQDHAATIRAMLPRAEKLEVDPREDDEWSNNYLRADAVVDLTCLAVLTGDEPTIRAAQDALLRLEPVFQNDGDAYQVYYLQAHRCLTLTALGDDDQAAKIIQQIPYIANQAYAYNLLACFALDKGDEPVYSRLSLEADRLFGLALRADAMKDEDNRLYISYLSWMMLYNRMYRVVETGRHSDPAAELGRWVEAYDNMQLQPGAKADCLGLLAYCYAYLDRDEQALALIERGRVAIKKEEQVDPDSFESYGVDFPRAELVRAYAAMSQWQQAEEEIERIESTATIALCRAIIAREAIRQGNQDLADTQIALLGTYLTDADAAVASPEHGPRGEDRTEDHPWYGYESGALYYDHYIFIDYLSRVGRGESLREDLGQPKSELSRFGIELGIVSGKLMPIPEAKPAGRE